MVIERFNMTELERIKRDLETLMSSYVSDDTPYTETEITWIRFGLARAIKIINKYIKEKN